MLSYNYAVSGSELVEWLRVPARKKLVILDACAAGKGAETMALAMNAKKAPASQDRILDQMQDKSGCYILAGCARDRSSYESMKYGQGLLTYSLLDGIRGAQLKYEGGEEYVDVPLLMQYAVKKVPALAQEEGHIQQPFLRSPDNQTIMYIGRMTDEDKKKIVISEPKPVFMACTFQDEDQLFDVLGLSGLINAELREITAKGKEAEFCFTEGKDYPDAYRLSGTYSVQGNLVKVNYIILKGKTKIGEKYSIQGEKAALKEMISRLFDEVKIRLENR